MQNMSAQTYHQNAHGKCKNLVSVGYHIDTY
jgi:hypothetical protein